ncbi:MAG TPA: phosphoribosylamine--glycine ligase [Candidatus Nanopelagicaceae bacterium]|nr:phosphoribosylamine--glycine ligase [Candidatus Nanopelagicaceae bacterium]
MSEDPAVAELHAAPGNPGIGEYAHLHPCDITIPEEIANLAERLKVDLVVIGPELPLVAGAADAVRARGIACFGPSAQAARIEGSKAFAKEVMVAAGVPTSRSRTCQTLGEVGQALDEFGAPYVVKDDGLAAGKGVVVTSDRELALAHATGCRSVVVEEFLDGPEISLFGITDGERVLALEPAQDFKRIGDGDTGGNTGGMGAYSPLPWAPEDLIEQVRDEILQPTIDELRRRDTPFVGLLYAGLALTSEGLKVIEFNARFGDPETQVLLARLRTPLAGILYRAATGAIGSEERLEFSSDSAVTVVIAAAGYPGEVRTGDEISGISEALADGALVFQAGTRSEGKRLLSAGGRVLSVTGVGPDLIKAREIAYQGVDAIVLAGSIHRSDIALAASEDSIGRE